MNFITRRYLKAKEGDVWSDRNFAGYKRLTFKYSEPWRDMDDREYLGLFRVLKQTPMRPYNAEDEFQDSGRYTILVRAPKNMDEQTMLNAMCDEFDRSCRCEHDCCGHWQHSVISVKRGKRKQWYVNVHTYMNI